MVFSKFFHLPAVEVRLVSCYTAHTTRLRGGIRMRRSLSRILPAAAAAALLLALTACAGAAEARSVERQFLAMDTVMSLALYGGGANGAAQSAVTELQRLEDLLSRTRPESAVSRLNESGRLDCGPELWELLRAASSYGEATGGAFDITVAPLVDAWGFTGEETRVPEDGELQGLLDRVGWDRVELLPDGKRVELAEGTELDLGAAAKGYAADRLASLFAREGVERGWASLGGNVLAWGTRPDGDPWRIGIQDPRYPDQQRFVGVLGLEDGFAVTSGSYQRYFEQNGVTYHHILNPADGKPARGGLVSVTVVAPADREAPGEGPGNGTMCDALSTALFVMGEEKALDFWRSGQYDFQLVLVTEDGRVAATSGLEGVFIPEEGSGYRYETVS